MAKKIFKTVGTVGGLALGLPGAAAGNLIGSVTGSMLGKKKKKADATPVAGAPITTPLDAAETLKRKKLNRQPLGASTGSTILSDTLGG